MVAFHQSLESTIGQVHNTPSTSSSQMSLSQDTFKNPQEFLSVLRKDFKQIAGDDNLITKEDLLIYSAYGEDRECRAAAKIALKHFDDMNELARFRSVSGRDYNYHEIRGRHVKAISSLDLEVATDTTNGNLGLHIALQEIEGVGRTLGAGIIAVACGIGTIAGLAAPPIVPVALGLGTVMWTVGTGFYGYNTYNAPGEIRALSQRNQTMLASWPEINSVSITGPARP